MERHGFVRCVFLSYFLLLNGTTTKVNNQDAYITTRRNYSSLWKGYLLLVFPDIPSFPSPGLSLLQETEICIQKELIPGDYSSYRTTQKEQTQHWIPNTSFVFTRHNRLDINRTLLTINIKHAKIKWHKSRTSFYPNSSATFNITILTSGDVHPHPGPKSALSNSNKQHTATIDKSSKTSKTSKAPKCPECSKTVQSNHKRFLCIVCFDMCHAKC
jgi:hypothetical protein